MMSIITRLRLSRLIISRVGIIALMVWFAIPDAQSHSVSLDTQLHPLQIKPALVQVGFAKHEQGNTITKQLLIIPCLKESSVFQQVPRLQKTQTSLRVSYYNSFYVYTTINAP